MDKNKEITNRNLSHALKMVWYKGIIYNFKYLSKQKNMKIRS